MKVTKIICDYCNQEIPTVKKKDIFGIERECYRMGKLNYGFEPFTNIDSAILGADLCERCAGLINIEIVKSLVALRL